MENSEWCAHLLSSCDFGSTLSLVSGTEHEWTMSHSHRPSPWNQHHLGLECGSPCGGYSAAPPLRGGLVGPWMLTG